MNSPPNSDMSISIIVTANQEACVRLTGDVDITSEPHLDALAQQLATSACTRVYVDLAGITFAGSTLIRFVFRLTSTSPRHHQVILCRPQPLLRRILALTMADRHAEIRGDLPSGWTMTPTSADAASTSLVAVPA